MADGNHQLAPLSDEERAAAPQLAPQPDDWTPIVPAPDDAPPRPQQAGETARWVYRDANSRLLMEVARFDRPDSKAFRPFAFCQHSDGKREWRPKGLPEPRPLYGLDQLASRPKAPVLIVEGEKAADAATSLFPDLVVVTSPNGSNSAGKADWSPLAGRRVTIWPDHDEPGRKYAEAVARLIGPAGGKVTGVVQVPEHFPAHWDLADPAPDGWSVDALRELVGSTVKIPQRFRMTNDGLLWLPDGDQPPIKVSDRFEVLAETRDASGKAWGILIAWKDRDGQEHEWAMPRAMLAGDASEVRQRLLDGGLFVAAGQKARNYLTEYLLTVQTTKRARCVDAVGWHGDAYVTPGKVYGGAAGERVVLQLAGAAAGFDSSGDLKGWRQNVGAYAVGNSRLALALSAAFAGPLLRLMGEESHGFHFAGGSSSGKTTALRVAASVWGIPIHTWRTTDNAAEGLARAANDGLLLLDELSQADGQAADRMAYMLGNGQGKGRMRKDATTKPVANWRLTFLSTGEVGLGDKIGETGKKAKAGQSVRMIEVPADAGAGHKLFDTLHGFEGGDALARHLRDATDMHRGHAGRLFLEHITAMDRAALVDALKKQAANWTAQNLPAGADGQVSRVAARFALTAAAGQLATEAGILPWPDGEAGRAAAVCFRAWLDQRGGVGSAEAETGLAQVQAFIEQHGMSRFTPFDEYQGDGSDKTINRVGYRRRDAQGRWEYLVLPEVWKQEICKGLDARAVAKDLIARSLIAPGSDGKSSKPQHIPGLGKTRVYHLKADILATGGE